MAIPAIVLEGEMTQPGTVVLEELQLEDGVDVAEETEPELAAVEEFRVELVAREEPQEEAAPLVESEPGTTAMVVALEPKVVGMKDSPPLDSPHDTEVVSTRVIGWSRVATGENKVGGVSR